MTLDTANSCSPAYWLIVGFEQNGRNNAEKERINDVENCSGINWKQAIFGIKPGINRTEEGGEKHAGQ